jgi:hypothetical protein
MASTNLRPTTRFIRTLSLSCSSRTKSTSSGQTASTRSWLSPCSNRAIPLTTQLSTTTKIAIRFAGLPVYFAKRMRFAASVIWCPTRNCYRACNLLCDLVHAIWCMRDFCATAKRTRNRTPNRIFDLVQKNIERDSCRTPNRDKPNLICDMQQIDHEIAHKIARVISPLTG